MVIGGNAGLRRPHLTTLFDCMVDAAYDRQWGAQAANRLVRLQKLLDRLAH